MSRRSLRTSLLALLAVASLGLAACGGEHGPTTEAHTEGLYLDLEALDYQVQISRVLNPSVPPDRSYVSGVPAFVSDPGDDETWFGVFLRVQNQTDRPAEATTNIHIVDTAGREYRPYNLDPEANPFAYTGGVVAPHSVMPDPDSAAGFSSAQGKLLLFKLTYESLGNRPLELVLEGEDGTEATVDLDI
jgi:hypothetical protein